MEPANNSHSLRLDLVTAQKLVMSEEVAQVVVPGEEGYFGVLPGHAPVLSTMRAGVIEIYTRNADIHRYFVRGGFAEVNDRQCTLIAEHARPMSELSHSDVQIEVSETKQVLERLVNTNASRDEIAEAQVR